MSQPFQYYSSEGHMSGGSPPRWRAGAPASLNPPENAIVQRPDNSSHAPADIAANPGGSGDRSGIANVTQFSVNAASHQRTIPDHVLENPAKFDDAPYVPPRLTQAELQPYPALDPRLNNAYDPPSLDIHHQYPYEGDTSPAESNHSVESNWSNSSSSSTSSQQLPGDYFVNLTTRYPQTPLPARPTYPQHYPAYHGQHRHGLEHVRYGEHPSNAGGSYYRTDPQGYPLDGSPSSEIFGNVGSRLSTSPQMNYLAASSHGSSSSSTVSAIHQSPTISTFSASPTSLMDVPHSRFPDAGPYLRQQLGLSPHEPVTLQSLPEPPPGEKPSTPLPMLVKLAIYGSPNKQLTLQEIYTALERRFQWFRDHRHEKAWKNSIRHNLSLNKVFQHAPRPVTEPGKGSYWQLDVSGGEGYKRTRKRRPKSKMMTSEEEDEDVSEMEEDRHPSESSGPSRLSTTPVEDANIDPGLRSEGHVVGEGRTRSTIRHSSGSPYPQPSRYQQGPLPVASGHDASAAGQSSIRFGQPSFGQASFPAYAPTQQMSVATSSASFASLSSTPVEMAPGTSMATRPALQLVVPYDRTARIPNPQPTPRSGIEYVTEPGGLPTARRVRTRGGSQDDPMRSPAESSSTPSQTRNDGRSRNRMQGSN